jgi:MHS family proline/betaine transporter-like MFS transporter
VFNNSAVRAIAAASIGNALEWYDQIVFGIFAIAIGAQFFPRQNPNSSLLIAFATFGAAFFCRPLGGLVIGLYADRAGRRAALLVTMLIMLIATLIIAVTPPYSAIGIVAPILVVTARLLQGFSAGGEFGCASAFLAEQSVQRRGLNASWQFASQGFAMGIAAAVGLALLHFFSAVQVQQGAWRLAFVFGLLIGPVLLYIRSQIEETPEFTRAQRSETPLADTIRGQKARLLVGLGAVILATVSLYMLLFIPTYVVRQLGLNITDGFFATLVAGAALTILTPVGGFLADRHGRLPVAIVAAVAIAVSSIPLYAWLSHAPSRIAVCAVQALLALLAAAYLGALAGFLADLFPVSNRTTGISMSYNLSVTIFGGFAPFVITWLIGKTGWIAAPGYYLAVAAVLSLVTLLVARRRGFR